MLAFASSFRLACADPAGSSLRGIVVDATTGLAVAGAAVSAIGSAARAETAADGRFALQLAPGVYRLRVERSGYQPAQSDDVALPSGTTVDITLSVQRESAPGMMRTIGSTSTNAAAALLRASTTSVTVGTDALRARGDERAGDALRQLPGITNGIAGDTAAFGDDIPLQLRGLGTLEATATIDEHPVAYGFPGGYNFQLSPIAPFRDVAVTYGSGSNVLGTSAIGGVVDFRTLVPSAERRLALDEGWGTFGRSATTLAATGTAGRVGYAFAYGASGIDGPIRHQAMYQPAAAYDVSATSPAVRGIGTYDDDSSVAQHAGLAKLEYDLGPADRVIATGVFAGYFENKSGNGDADYLDAAPALAFAQSKAGTGGCGAGTRAGAQRCERSRRHRPRRRCGRRQPVSAGGAVRRSDDGIPRRRAGVPDVRPWRRATRLRARRREPHRARRAVLRSLHRPCEPAIPAAVHRGSGRQLLHHGQCRERRRRRALRRLRRQEEYLRAPATRTSTRRSR